jgi:tripartite-type tricarboxylate transporter receptor subunit TctC
MCIALRRWGAPHCALNECQPRRDAVIRLCGLFCAWLLALFVVGTGAAAAQSFPSNRIRFIVPYTPGGGGDIIARLLAERLQVSLGQPIVVENHGGASGEIGTELGARAAPDGYTWTLAADPGFTINPLMVKVPYDPIRDFEPVSLLTKIPLVLVSSPTLPVHTVRELVDYAKRSPEPLKVALLGSGSNARLAGELLMSMTGIKFLFVPYKGQAEALIGIMGGFVDITFSSISSVQAYLQSDKLRALAVTSDQRFQTLPDIPTVSESGYPGFEVSAWHGVVVPAGTPKEIVLRLNQEFSRVLETPQVRQRLLNLGFAPVGGDPQNLQKLLQTDTERWRKLIRSAGIKPD